MRTTLLLCFSTLFLVSCSGIESGSKTTSIINGSNEPKWEVLTGESFASSGVMANVFRIQIGEDWVGTGFVLGPDAKTLITNAHVATFLKHCEFHAFADCSKKTASNYFNSAALGEVVTIDSELDFALITLEWKKVEAPPRELNIACDDSTNLLNTNIPVFIIGSLVDETFVKSEGVITERDAVKKLKPSFLYTADTLPGMSGSPVFDSNSNLIGLHWGSCINKACNQAIPFSLINQKYSLKECKR